MRGWEATKVPEPWRRRSSPSSSMARRASRRVARDTWSSAASSGSEGRRVPAGSSPRSIRCLSSSWTETERSRGRAPVARCGLCILARSIRQTTQPGSRSLTRYEHALTIRPASSNVRQLPDAAMAAVDADKGVGRGSGTTPSRIGELRGGRRGLLRQAHAQAARGLLVAVVAGGGGRHLGRLLRLEPGARRRRVRRAADRDRGHHDHVLRPVLQHRRDVAGPAPHRRGLLLRPLGHGALGRVHHRTGREHGVRHHPGRGRGGDGLPDARHRGRAVRHRRLTLVEQPGDLVGGLLRDLRGDQHHRHRGHDAVHRGDQHPRPRDPGLLLHLGAGVGQARHQPVDQHRRRRAAAPASCPRGSPASSRPSRSPSGSTWPSRSCRWPPRSPTTRPATSPGPPSGASSP